MYEQDDVVWAQWPEDQMWYTGRIINVTNFSSGEPSILTVSACERRFYIHFADGDKACMSAEKLCPWFPKGYSKGKHAKDRSWLPVFGSEQGVAMFCSRPSSHLSSPLHHPPSIIPALHHPTTLTSLLMPPCHCPLMRCPLTCLSPAAAHHVAR